MADRCGRAAGIPQKGDCGSDDEQSGGGNFAAGQGSLLLLRMVKCSLGQECGKMWFFACVGGDDGQTGNGCGRDESIAGGGDWVRE